MGTTGSEVADLLMALGLLLVAAHVVGHQFALLGMPRVVGEIAGGLLLGPTVFGALAPHAQSALFPEHGETAAVVGWTYQLGLLLLMFCSGTEMRSLFCRDEARVVGFVAVIGVVVPFCAGALLFRFVDASPLMGDAQSPGAVLVVFALAIAVTSIPVISRIMLDLGVIETSFARVVLGVAVLEDAVVYVVLAITLAAASVDEEQTGVPSLLGLEAGSASGLTFHVVATLTVFVVTLVFGARAFSWTLRQRWNLVARGNPIAYLMMVLFGGALACLALGVNPIFGAFVTGIAVSAEPAASVVRARESVRAFSFAFFVPVYFAIVGLQLDLARHLDVLFLGWFLVLACVVKTASVFAAAKLAGETSQAGWNLALATNARGGPCIVLASVTFGAGIISEDFYAALVMLAIITSLITGILLGRKVRSGEPLRGAPGPQRQAAAGEAGRPEPELVAAGEAPVLDRGQHRLRRTGVLRKLRARWAG
jgi:Kef-type K+ transport system membrane component KefB